MTRPALCFFIRFIYVLRWIFLIHANATILPRNGAPFNIPLVIVFKSKSFLATGAINDTAVVDIAQDIFTKPHTNNNETWYTPVPKSDYRVYENYYYYTYIISIIQWRAQFCPNELVDTYAHKWHISIVFHRFLFWTCEINRLV